MDKINRGISCRALLAHCEVSEHSALILQHGPINKTYFVLRDGIEYAVRRRLPNLARNNQLFAAEEYVTPLLRGRVHLPELICVNRSRHRRLAVFRFIRGTQPDWHDPNTQQQLVQILCDIHGVGGKGLGPVNRARPFDDYGRYLRNLYLREVAVFRRSAKMHEKEDRKLVERALEFRLFSGRSVTLCHGDVHPKNFLTDHDGVLWTIDWEAARFRFPEADFNQFHVEWFSVNEQESLIAEYCARTRLPEASFKSGVVLFQLLWHLRSYNFFVSGLGQHASLHRSHVDGIRFLLGGL